MERLFRVESIQTIGARERTVQSSILAVQVLREAYMRRTENGLRLFWCQWVCFVDEAQKEKFAHSHFARSCYKQGVIAFGYNVHLKKAERALQESVGIRYTAGIAL